MKRFGINWLWRIVAVVFAILLPPRMQAAVTNIAWYRLGENDSGGTLGGIVNSTTTDLIGTNHLKSFGSPRYTNGVSVAAASGLGSTLAGRFNGTSQYFSNAVVSTAINNFGVEAWVKPSATDTGNRTIVYNGSPVASGWGFIQRGGTEYSGSLGTMSSFGSGTAASGTWAHLALVRDNGTTTFYVNGVANATSAGVPIAATNAFIIAAHPQLAANTFFNGSVDEVRVFTFAPGQFSTNDLLFNLQRVTTLAPTALTVSNALLNGVANPLAIPTSAWFQWGTTTNYGNLTAPQSLSSASNQVAFSQTVSNLAAGVMYHFRAVVSNSLGVVFGTNQNFLLPIFSLAVTNLTGLQDGDAAWGDYDNDGRLDLVLAGYTGSALISQIWRNTGSGFTNIDAGLPGVYRSGAAWSDYDNDGRLDFVLAGDADVDFTQVWRNTGSGFSLSTLALPGLAYSAAAWGDYDNDGRLDLILTGYTGTNSITQIWRNTGNTFYDIQAGLPGILESSVAWGDYDNDGRLDILMSGRMTIGGNISQVWRNTGSGFTNINAGLPGVNYSSVAWGDYDCDGRLDILLTGLSNSIPLAQVWRNTGSGFTNINAGLPGVIGSSSVWGDYDNDGHLDILLTGAITAGVPVIDYISQVWRNTGSGFTNTVAGLPGVSQGTAAWGDYDNDGRLDILLCGLTNSSPSGRTLQLWKNHTPLSNSPPTAPSGLQVIGSSINTVTFDWNAATDNETPANGLTYNLRVGTTPGGSELVGAMAAGNGFRRLPALGNAHGATFRFISLPAGQTVYWSVQAVDSSFAGSPFAPEQSFTFSTVITPPNGIPVPGDTNGDGIVDQSELAAVLANLNGNGIVNESILNLILSNYFPNSPFLEMTNVAGLGGTNVTFALPNSTAGSFSMEYTTNLTDWYFLGAATPLYEFTDTNAPVNPQRYYRLRWP